MQLFKIHFRDSDVIRLVTKQELGLIEDWSKVTGVKPMPWPEFYTREMLDTAGFYASLVDVMGDDLSPLRNARMSTGNATGESAKKDDGLRDKLWRERHTSPFESVILVYELVVPMFVLRQIDRHRTISISNMSIEVIEDYDQSRKFTSRNEFSARYSEMPDLYYQPSYARFRGKHKANKQQSGEELSEDAQVFCEGLVKGDTARAREVYQILLGNGVAGELARIVLPQNQGTKIRLQATLLNWFQFLDLRMRSDVQEETRAYATAIAESIQILLPKAYEAFEEYTLHAKHVSRTEAAELVGLLRMLPPSSAEEAGKVMELILKLSKAP
jgi:thymidylate synthase (FAD)